MNFDPKDRKAVIEGVGEYLTEAVRKALDAATRSCLNCDHFQPGPPDRSREVCGLNGLMPPPSIAARGCDNYEDQIPF